MDFVWGIIGLPLLGFALNGFFIRQRRFAGWIGCSSVAIAFAGALWLLADLLSLAPERQRVIVTLANWMSVGDLHVSFGLLVDPLSVLMVLLITGVGGLIHIYSLGYMREDRDFVRYFAYLNLFIASMLLLVLADNFLVLFMGWELVGLCSYLLIGHWFEKESAANAARKAFVVNRIGDAAFMVGLFLIFATFGSFEYASVFAGAGQLALGSGLATAIALLLFAGAVGKSAQIPLYVWLPDAMEGPTPVSALIHAATMVTAGVYLVVRAHALFALSPLAMDVVAATGAFTALFAASMALVHTDLKRVLAYSTVSQLGYMFLAAGTGLYSAAMFHLVGHAFMKASLFLGAGSVLHALGGERTDMRQMGGLFKKIPTTGVVFIIGALAMAGLPPLVGFFSKDLILAGAFGGGHLALWGVGLATAVLTAFYMGRATYLTFFGAPRYPKALDKKIHESPPSMLAPLGTLALLSLAGGALGVGWASGSGALQQFLQPVYEAGQLEHIGLDLAQEAVLALVSVLAALAGLSFAFWLYRRKRPSMPKPLVPVYQVLSHQYWVDEGVQRALVKPFGVVAGALAQAFDLGVLNRLVEWVGGRFERTGALLGRLQSGLVRSYATLMLLGVAIVLFYWLLLMKV